MGGKNKLKASEHSEELVLRLVNRQLVAVVFSERLHDLAQPLRVLLQLPGRGRHAVVQVLLNDLLGEGVLFRAQNLRLELYFEDQRC